MVDAKQPKTIGQLRMEYLDIASRAKTAQEWNTMKEYIDNFLNTIPDGKEIAGLVNEKFKEIDERGKTTEHTLIDETELSKGLNIYEQSEARSSGFNNILINKWKDQLDYCWKLAMEKGLFYE